MAQQVPISENILNAYQSYTYNFTLYAVDRETHSYILEKNVDFEEIHTHVRRNAGKKAIIVQSGVTNMSIDDLSIMSYPTPTDATILSKLSFKITQPKGFSFIESVATAGALCGWDSFIGSPFLILEIDFKGLPHNSPMSKTSSYIPKKIKTVSIPIQISQVNTELDGGGTRHSVEAAVLFNWSRQVYNTTMAAFTVDSCMNFSDFLDKFSSNLNNEIEKDASRNDIYKTIHRFKIDDDIGSITLNASETQENPSYNSSGVQSTEGASGVSFTIPNQMSIPKVIESVLLASKQMQDLLKIDSENEIFGKTFQIDPTVKIKEFNYAMGEYTFDIVWHIRLVPTQLVRNINKANVSSKAFDYINNREFCKFSKVYYHYYTGKNTEVLSANLDLNNLYFNKLARYNSLFANEANNSTNIQGEGKTSEAVKQMLTDVNENPNNSEKSSQTKSKNQKISGRYSDSVVYVDDVRVADLEQLAKLPLLYRFARDTQSSIPQRVSAESTGVRTQDMADELRNIRNQLQLSAMKLTLEIKGDPYWLTPIHGNYETNSTERLSNIQANVIGFATGFPNEVQEKGLRNDYMFSGIYLVKNVISSFNSGKFTQKLECARYHHIDSSTFQKNYVKGNNNGS